jgi:hypothetical protein
LDGGVASGRIERAGLGFAITVPRKWAVRVAEPGTSIYTAAPGDAWEAVRAHSRDAALLGLRGIVPPEAGPLGESPSIDTDEDATELYWSGRERPTLVVPPARFHEHASSNSRDAAGIPRLHHKADTSAQSCGCLADPGPASNPGALKVAGLPSLSALDPEWRLCQRAATQWLSGWDWLRRH